MNQDIKWWTLVCIPFVLLFSIGLILSTEIFFIFKIVLIVIVCAIISITKRVMLDDNLQSQLPLMFYWATMAFFYVSWAVYIAPVAPTLMSFLFGVLNFVLFICFIVLLKGEFEALLNLKFSFLKLVKFSRRPRNFKINTK